MSSSSPPLPPLPAGTLSVLIVDDLVEIRQLVTLWLSRAGHTVFEAGNGRIALRLMERHHFDLLITDVIMPECDGIEVLGQLKKLPFMPRVLAMSGGGQHLGPTDCLRMAKSMGAHVTLRKPFDRTQLFEAIRETMGWAAPSDAAANIEPAS